MARPLVLSSPRRERPPPAKPAMSDSSQEPLMKEAGMEAGRCTTDGLVGGGKNVTNDDDGMWVLVFTKDKGKGGTVNADDTRKDPAEDAKKLFVRDQYAMSKVDAQLENQVLKKFSRGEITEEVFQNIVRDYVLILLSQSGFSVRAFDSVDGDEAFLVLDLEEPSTLTNLALRYDCKLPFTKQAYCKMQPPEPMNTSEGDPVPAFGEYETDTKGLLEDFKHVDKLRLMKTSLDHKMSLEWMMIMNVISGAFPVQTVQEQHRLDQTWVRSWSLHETEQDCVRNYFGEEIAFFFRWVEFYIHMLLPLAVLGIGLSFCRHFLPNSHKLPIFTATLGTSILVWAALFNRLFSFTSARSRARWGMEDFKQIYGEIGGYRRDLDNTYQLLFQKSLVVIVQILYVLLFVGLVFWLKRAEKNAREEKLSDSFFVQYGATLTVTTIRVSSWLWSNIAPILVKFENHKSLDAAEDSLSKKLAGMTIFVALWNFIFGAFIRNQLPFTCSSSLDSLVERIWEDGQATQGEIDHLELYYTYTKKRGDGVCLRGCFPLIPADSHPKGWNSCDKDLARDLFAFFMFDLVVTIIFLVLPILLIRRDIHNEQERAKKLRGEQKYTWLQVLNKRFSQACYQYKSNGGSPVEDFMQFAINFALITCFGILYPPVVVIALLTTVVEYKIMAYRMVHITCRPEPRGGRGIGSWEEIFDKICQCAIVTNAALAVFDMPPARLWPMERQFFCFIALEHILLAAYATVQSIMPDRPADVANIEDFNEAFKRSVPQIVAPNQTEYAPTPDKTTLGYDKVKIHISDVN